MKSFLIFTAVLLSSLSQLYSCGYDPRGEDLRFSLFLPENFNYQDFSAFNYQANSFGFEYNYDNQYESNVYDWYLFTHKKVTLSEINNCLNSLQLTDINHQSPNQFVQYLYKNKFNNVIQYLIVAKKCETYNSFEFEDPWERDDSLQLKYDSFTKQLVQILNAEKNTFLKRKYAFLTIRTAYYGKNYPLLKDLFETYFAHGEKDYLYYWALYFNCFENQNAGIDIANIMAFSKEKRYATYYFFHEQFNLNKALLKAKKSSDIALLYAYASVQRLAPNLDYLITIYNNSTRLKILDFLLLREINKIEDWVYTPYYVNYLPSIEDANYRWADRFEDNYSTKMLRDRSEKERLYAKKVLQFINSVDYSKIYDISLWKAAEIQLLFITKDYKTCLNKIMSFEKKYSKEKCYSQIEQIKALCIISDQEAGKAIIPNVIKPIILKNLNDNRFLFALGRELEFRQNIQDGLAFISYNTKKQYNSFYQNENFYKSTIEWKGNRILTSGNLKYFYEYFDYLDFVYSADDLQKIVNKLNTKFTEQFYATIYAQLLQDKNYLTDLLGTKYIRENRLYDALKTFESISSKYWEENYNPWERDKFKTDVSFDLNPFYDIKYTPSFIPHEEKFLVTKLSVTKHLIKYLELASNSKTEHRDYYYFLVANCYLSMTQYGHSWMMRRYFSTTDFTHGNNESYIDDIEYRNGYLAQQYYHLAYKYAKTNQFKALCLRMEDFAIDNIDSKFLKLKTNYPEYYEDLSSCENFAKYFKNR